MDPISIATQGKGFRNVLRRIRIITNRYGLTSRKMDDSLEEFARLLQTYSASATFPITAVALRRNRTTIQHLVGQGIEFAIHGYTHVDHSSLTLEKQVIQLNKAVSAFEASRIPFRGFRCPYLRWNQGTLAALRHHQFLYDSSQGLVWDVLNGKDTPAYHRVIDFYGAHSASDYPALPHRDKEGLIHIPYCLPDDEALIDRLQLETVEARSEVWLKMLRQIYDLGELFTVGLHPERISLLAEPLAATLAQARSLVPIVWIARLDEIANWWHDRTETNVVMNSSTNHDIQVTVDGPQAVTILTRNLLVNGPTIPWADKYGRVMAKTFTISTAQRPVIGISPKSAESLIDFLRQQGYLIEINEDPQDYPFYVERLDFKPEDERLLLAQIESSNWPLLRLGRWPNGARSALCVTGDIDALTLWDYGLRFLGN